MNSLVSRTTRPSGATIPEMPVFAARMRYIRFSMALNTAMAKCCFGAALRPNQASFVIFTSSVAPSWTNCRTSPGKMAS